MFAAAAAVWLACAPVEPEAPAGPPAHDALAFAKALAAGDADGLARWTRSERPVAVRRRCQECPPAARWRHDSIWTPERWSAVAPPPTKLEWRPAQGQVSCDRRCCSWPLGLMDHATVYLHSLCFEHDAQGWYVASLEVVDG